ncbi:hypothetical protein C8J57DRAFT_1504074 [Mycena rebaudengoi]|nr:hypothetical protein C8J57DRAFT_1504074 [Mycena rebaudengoi]
MYLQAASDTADLFTPTFMSVLISFKIPFHVVIEGLSILFESFSITKKASIQLLLNDLITVIPHTTWPQIDGILNNDDHDFVPGDWITGLGVAYVRNVTSPELRDWMKAYIGVQFNAVIDLAANGTNIYGYVWKGPPSSTFDGGAQTDAIRVLLSAVSFENDSQASSPTPSSTRAILPSPSSRAVSGRSSTTGPIVGGVIGGIALLSCIILVFWMVRRRQLWRAQEGPFLRPLSRQKTKLNAAAVSPPTSGDQWDGAAPWEAVHADNTHPRGANLDVQSLDIRTAWAVVEMLHQRLQNEDHPPEYLASSLSHQ